MTTFVDPSAKHQRLIAMLEAMTTANGCTEAEARTAREKAGKIRSVESERQRRVAQHARKAGRRDFYQRAVGASAGVLCLVALILLMPLVTTFDDTLGSAAFATAFAHAAQVYSAVLHTLTIPLTVLLAFAVRVNHIRFGDPYPGAPWDGVPACWAVMFFLIATWRPGSGNDDFDLHRSGANMLVAFGLTVLGYGAASVFTRWARSAG